MVVAHTGKLREFSWLECECVLLLPCFIRIRFKAQSAIRGSKAITTPKLFLFEARFQPQWLDKRISESDIGQPVLLEFDPKCHVIELGPISPLASTDSGRQQCHLKPQFAQQRGKGSIHFVAEAATPFVNKLVQEAALLADNFSPEADIQILEGHCVHVGAVQRTE